MVCVYLCVCVCVCARSCVSTNQNSGCKLKPFKRQIENKSDAGLSFLVLFINYNFEVVFYNSSEIQIDNSTYYFCWLFLILSFSHVSFYVSLLIT